MNSDFDIEVEEDITIVKEELIDSSDVEIIEDDIEIKPEVVNRPRIPIFFSCSECEFTTKFKWCFDDHISTNHKTDPQKTILQNGEYKICPDCDYKTKKLTCLKCHIGCKHSELVKNWQQCPECPFKTKCSYKIRKHIHVKHVLKNTKSIIEVHNCEKCSFSTNSESNFKKHVSKCLSQHVQPIECSCKKCCSELQSFKCSFCVQSFSNENNLNEHLKMHHPRNQKLPSKETTLKKQYKCSSCPYSGKTFCDLKHHITHRHTDEKNIEFKQCPQCDYQAKTQHYLQKHFKYKHVKHDFKCKECSFVTKASYLLENHVVRKHTSPEEKNIRCEYCDFRTKLTRLLKVHIASRHDITCKKICTKCSFVAKTQSELKEHKMEHDKSV